MKNKTGANRACKDSNPIIGCRKANFNLAYLGANKPRNNLQLGLNTSKMILVIKNQVKIN